jgi:signal transduction histidine kinase/DNA-binding response OmpR family regulator
MTSSNQTEKPIIKEFHILVIEDDEGLNYLIRKRLKKEGYQTTGALNAAEAFEKASGNPNELLLLDYQLPDSTGKEIIIELQKRIGKTPNFIVITGFGDENTAVEMMKLGAIDYLVKNPDFLDIFVNKVEKTCNDLHNINRLSVAEADLEKSNLLLHETGVIARAGGWEMDTSTGHFQWTSTARMIFEVDDNFNPTLQSIRPFFIKDDNPEIHEIIGNAIAKCKDFDIERKFITGKGKELWIRVIGKIKKDKEKCLRLFGVFQDITTQKQQQLEQDLREKHLQSLLQNPEGYVIYRTKADITQTKIEVIHVSPSFSSLLGIPDKDKYSFISWFNYVHPDDLQKLMTANANGMKPPFVFTEQIRYIHPEKGVRWLDIRSRGIPYDQDPKKIEYANGIILDITNQKQTEEDLIVALEKAQEADRLKSAFLANMSHEIRTPMNGILGFIKLLKTPDLSESKRQQYTDVIQKSSDRLLCTLNDLIDISKIEAGQTKLDNTIFSIEMLGKDISDFYLHEIESKGITFRLLNEFNLSEAFIYSDYDKLFGILSNLVKNAIKFTSKGEIKVVFKRLQEKLGEDLLKISVQDTGIGIPDNRIDAIFNRFEMADIEDKAVYEGSGLGLALAKAYTELLGGEISVSSKVDHGSTFTCILPWTCAESGHQQSNYTSHSSPDISALLKDKTILVAEDDTHSTSLLKEILEPIAKKVVYAANGKEVLNVYKNNPSTDIILMDIRMPVMDGIKATLEIREKNPDVIIIAQTAYALSGDSEKALEAGCNDYIAKPISKEMLFETILRNLS